MLFRYVILLFLSWPQTRCVQDVDAKGEEIFDQLATASENVAHALRYSNTTSKNLQEQLPSVSTSLGTTTHYENSNGFIPIIPTDTPYDEPDSSSFQNDNLEEQDEQSEDGNTTNAVSAHQDSSTTKAGKLEEDIAYSSEARIFLNLPGPLTNRRSFDLQERPSEFELLKVNNDTPAVANYQDFYENLRSTVNTETGDSEPDETPSGRANGERGKRIESYGYNYSRQSQQTKNKEPYIQYYSYSDAQDTKKLTYEPEKVAGNYRQRDTANYDGHGQSAVRQNVPTVPSSSRTNYKVNELTHGGPLGGAFDNAAESSRAHHKFSRPVVVAEPSSYKVEMKFNGQPQISEADYKTSRNLESSSAETSNYYDVYNDNRQRSYHRPEDSRNLSDESSDYSEYIERPRRVQKGRKRLPYADSSRKLPKEHRGTLANSAEVQDKHNYNSSRLKSQRHRVKANPWVDDASINLQEDSVEDIRHDIRVSGTEIKSTKMQHGSKMKNNMWNQISPTLEISHSNGVELDQLEKPKYVFPVKVNFVPVASFDHATALDNSQNFDVSNAILQNMVTASPIAAYTTSAPLLSTSSSILGQNLAISKNVANTANLGVSTSVPDIIVGQNSFQNPVHAVMLSQSNGQNKAMDAVRAAYLPSTMAPVFALTSSLTPTLQSVRLQNVQNGVTPRTAFAVTPTPTAVVQHVPFNQVQTGVQQLLVPQPTVQTFPGFIQTPVHANTEYQIQVNPRGLQGQNLMNHGNVQMQSLPTTPESRINMSPEETQSKKNIYATSGGNLVATATIAVDQNEQKQAANSYYLHNHNTQVAKPQEQLYQVVKGIDMTPKTKTYLQATQVVPTVLQPNPTLSGIAVNTPQYVKVQGNGVDDAMQQPMLQIQLNRAQLLKNSRLPGVTLQAADNVVSQSNSVHAHLPNVGAKNVEIVNPNIKPSPIDTTVDAYNTMHYPAAVLTTPIPIFSTIGPVTPQTINLQNYVDSLTESSTKAKQLGTTDLRTSPNQERPMFNPINFVPNADIMKNQNTLNNKLPSNEPVQQGLNLVPVMPGGNFFKPSFAAQNELIMKPKLASDLQKYAEEMFKESLKTMYNSQKWNNDRKPSGINQNNSETSDLANLRLELQKLKASLSETKYKDQLEAHQSENKVRTTDAPKSSSDKKKPDMLLATLEHLLKNRPSGPIHIYHGGNRPSRKPKPSGDSSFGFHDELHSDSPLTEFLTPPRPNHLRTKGEKFIKYKRPGTARFKHGPRKPNRGFLPSRSNGMEASASNIDIHLDGSHYHRPPFDVDNVDFETRHQPSFDTYPTFTTSSPDIFNNILRELRASNKDYDINHPRVHNLLGLLMKNKQLPSRSTQSYYRDKDQLGQLFDNERSQLQQQFYDDYILDKFDGASQSSLIANRKVYPGNGAA